MPEGIGDGRQSGQFAQQASGIRLHPAQSAVARSSTNSSPPIPRANSSFYRPELDVVRCFAFLAVFVYHSTYYEAKPIANAHVAAWISQLQASIGRSGAYGVDLFFVLSAYLITELLIREKEQCGALDVKSFYLRRMLRIWPLYYLFVPLAATIPFLDPFHTFTWHYWVPFLLLAGNWSTIAFGPPYSAALPLWSVSVEEQFYILWPPLVARLSLRNIAWAAVIMLIIANCTRILVLLLHGSGWSVWANTLARLDPMAAGILLAIVLRGRSPNIGAFWRLLLIAGGALSILITGHLAIGWGDGLPWVGTLVSYPVVAVAATAIVAGSIGIPIRVRPLEYLGKISYGLYVYHQMCIWMTDTIMQGHGVLHSIMREILALAITILVAALSYALFEKSFLSLKRRFTYVQSRPV
jgi:peptidoglycan/LPS O-acetylase OafA/YrhL